MILQALNDLYHRLGNKVSPIGWGRQAIPFLAVIDRQGRFLRFEDTREGKQGKVFCVPILGEKKGSGIKANLCWETIEYMFGIPSEKKEGEGGGQKRLAAKHAEFLRRLGLLAGDDPTVVALRKFAALSQKEQVQRDPLWPEIRSQNPWILLALEGVGPVTAIPAVQKAIDAIPSVAFRRGVCLVTGNEDEIMQLEPPIKGVRGSQTTGGSLVAVNNEVKNGVNQGQTPAFASYLQQQAFNSPIGRRAGFAYTTALNYLLAKDSPHHLQVGDATAVFWSERPTPLENDFPWFFQAPPKDDPGRQVEAIRQLHESVVRGGYAPSDADTRFFVLGLAPNAARLAVRFWMCSTVRQMAVNIDRHFQDLEMGHGPNEPGDLGLFGLLRAVAPQGNAENIPPNLGGEVMRAILQGTPYPNTLLQAAIRRIRAERSVTLPRAALIKACLNRLSHCGIHRKEDELTVTLDLSQTNVGYRLGRLFAVLEKIQSEASPGLNTTIRDRFYGAASGSPGSVFPALIRLSRHHVAKLSTGLRTVRERLIQEIVAALPSQGFPAHLDLADQGRFAIGYYHQMQAFYTKNELSNKE